MTPVSGEARVAREVGQFELGPDSLQLNSARRLARIARCAGPLQRDGYRVAAFYRHPAKLNVAEPYQTGRAPILQDVRKSVRVHECAPGLTGAEVPQLAVSMPQPECS